MSALRHLVAVTLAHLWSVNDNAAPDSGKVIGRVTNELSEVMN
jgi:hypothetical protein